MQEIQAKVASDAARNISATNRIAILPRMMLGQVGRWILDDVDRQLQQTFVSLFPWWQQATGNSCEFISHCSAVFNRQVPNSFNYFEYTVDPNERICIHRYIVVGCWLAQLALGTWSTVVDHDASILGNNEDKG